LGELIRLTWEEKIHPDVLATHIAACDVDGATVEAYKKALKQARQRRYRAKKGKIVKPKHSPRETAILEVVTDWKSINDIAHALASNHEFKKRGKRKMKPSVLYKTVYRCVKDLVKKGHAEEKFEGMGPKAVLMFRSA
jgi:hypothetical protein